MQGFRHPDRQVSAAGGTGSTSEAEYVHARNEPILTRSPFWSGCRRRTFTPRGDKNRKPTVVRVVLCCVCACVCLCVREWSTSSSSIALSRFSFGQHFAGKTNKWKRSRKTGRLGGRGGGRTGGGGGGGHLLQRATGSPEQSVCIAGHSNMYTTHSTVTHTHTHHTATHNTHKHNYNSENCPEMELVYIFSTASRLKFGRTSNYKASVVTGGFITTLRRFRPKCVLRTRRNCKYEKSNEMAMKWQ
jgi:hypothetical protein